MDYVAKFPFVTATAFIMDCSGGQVFTTAAALERAYKAAAMLFAPSEIASANAELAKFNGEQIEWIALGGKWSGEPYEGAGETPNVSEQTERLLNSLYGY